MLQVFNSLGRARQVFEPLREGFVGVYVCGPTVYGDSHIGHAKSYVSFDVIVRYLRFLGYRVRYVQNITDVGHLTDNADAGQDKVGEKARVLGIEPMEVAERYTRSYFEDMDALNVARPDISPRASGHIPEQIELVRALFGSGHAYEVNGNVYFDVTSFPGYGKLSGRRLDEIMEGARVEVSEDKRHPADFALWKRAEPGHIMRWASPWGVGFPGWHLECSVMSMKYLGETLDIHGGGLENIFPHHEDEVAQSECATGRPFVRYWLHNNMVTVGGQKMGKSLGNFITLKDAFAGKPPLGVPVRPLVVRYFVLTSHYRSPLDFSPQALEAASKGLERIEQAVSEIRRRLQLVPPAERQGAVPPPIAQIIEQARKDFLADMDDDFNTAAALGQLGKLTREVNRLLDSGDALGAPALAALDAVYSHVGEDILGILADVEEDDFESDAESYSRSRAMSRRRSSLSRYTRSISRQMPAGSVSAAKARSSITMSAELIEALTETRTALRKAGQYELADTIRSRLAKLGIELKDGPEGTTWQYK